MKTQLLDVLRCPVCAGTLAASDVVECTGCGARWPVRDGVPCMLSRAVAASHARRGFEYQWQLRLRGDCEPSHRCYGFRTREFASWLVEQYGLGDGEEPGWLIDVGCGSGEKTAEIARLCPRHQVVGLDLSGTLGISARRYDHVPNLHFVQGDVLHAPFAPRSFQSGLSVGVLHHTPDTSTAFRRMAELIAVGGKMMTWLYPLPEEDRFWAAAYKQRDKVFMGLGYRLPPRLLMALCRLYVLLSLGPMYRFVRAAREARPEFVFSERDWTLLEFYRTSVFLTFDTVMPKYQHRHGRPAVTDWYVQSGFADVDARFSGFFCGRRVAAAAS
jgi:SAM-dependent methyltransferase